MQNNKLIKFILVGILNTAFGYSLFALFIFLNMHYSLAVFLSTVLGVLFNFKSDIYMISKYDNILSYLSNKYTGLPFFELRSTIVTEDEFEIIENIFSEKADIIFVDNDIEMNFDDEIRKRSFFDIYSDTMERDNLLVRIKKLETLKKLFQNIKNNYELVEKGKLVSVYKKKFFSVNK